jgi:7-keto-8-aminopelargonate synthetase-like enzyme
LAQRIELFDRRVATAERGNALPIRMISVASETSAIAIARELFDAGFYTSVTFFPTVAQGKAGIRVCLTADHEIRDIERLCDQIQEGVADAVNKPRTVSTLA